MRDRIPDLKTISPSEFERRVEKWLRSTPQKLVGFRTAHLETQIGVGGEHAIDAVAEFEVLGGARITVLVECKHQKAPVKREVIMVLQAKLQDTGAHKGIVFSTAGFQRGALQYARTHGIAAVRVADGSVVYEAKSKDGVAHIPPWVPICDYVGYMISYIDERRTGYHLIDDERPDALTEWLNSTGESAT
jgi:restriction system protein